MSTKEKIYQLVDQMDDEKQLQALEELEQILKPKLNPILKEKLTRSALKSNEDIKAGRFYTREQIEQRSNQRLGL